MAIETGAIGKTFDAVEFVVEADRIRQYADAVGAGSPLHQDAGAAREAGFRDLVAPPMFTVVYSAQALGNVLVDPEVALNLMTMVHGGQDFSWSEPVCAGDTIATGVTVEDISERDGKGFYVFESLSTNQNGQEVVRATWTNIVRGV